MGRCVFPLTQVLLNIWDGDTDYWLFWALTEACEAAGLPDING